MAKSTSSKSSSKSKKPSTSKSAAPAKKTAAAKASETIEATAVDVTDQVADTVSDAADLVSDAASDVVDNAKDTASVASEKAEEAVEAVAEEASKAADAVELSEPAADTSEEPAKDEAPEAPAPAPESAPEPLPAPVEQVVVEKNASIFPLLIGGVIAGLIGFGVARYIQPEDNSAALIAPLETQIEELTVKVDAAQTAADSAADAAAAIDLAALTDGLAAATSQIEDADIARTALTDQVSATSDSLASLDQRLTDLDTRLTTLEKKPIADSVSREAIAAYERELALLQEAMAGERQAIEELLEQQRAEVARIAEEASQMEERALAEAQATAAREALARVQLALDAGDPFETALQDISAASGVDISDDLLAVAGEGIATLPTLQASYPDAARAALGAARTAGESGDQGGLLGYLQAQVGARSVEPQEGSSVDAVLSRVEDAVKRDALTEALTEIEALPASSREALADWEAAARARLAAITAAADLAAGLN